MIVSRLGIKMFSSSLQAWLGLEFGLNYTIESVDPRDRIKRKQKKYDTTLHCVEEIQNAKKYQLGQYDSEPPQRRARHYKDKAVYP